MKCRKARECLSEYIDGELSAHATGALLSHLDACADCREEHRLLVTTRHLLSTYGPTAAPVDFTHLAARMTVRGGWSEALLWLRRGLVATTATAASLVVLWQWQRPTTLPPGPQPARFVAREAAEVEELHQAFAVQQSLESRDGLLLYAPKWVERGP